MIIKQDPITKLWCREDGAVLMPPSKRFPRFRWTFGCKTPTGYKQIKFQCKTYFAHQIACRAFNGPAPADKPLVDHINRIKDDNRPKNLRWVDHKENGDNQSSVDRSIAKYGVRYCKNKVAYYRAHDKAYYEAHREERKQRMRAYATTKRAEKEGSRAH